MSQPTHISELMHQLVQNDPNDPFAQLLRHCPFIQAQMLQKGYMSLSDLTPEEIARLERCQLEGFDLNAVRQMEEEQ